MGRSGTDTREADRPNQGPQMKRGEIWSVSLEPTRGREQQGLRRVLIASPDILNAISPPIVCPITTAGLGQRESGFTVSLAAAGLDTTGVVLCLQVRTLDLRARKARRIEAVPDFILDEVLSCLQDIFEL